MTADHGEALGEEGRFGHGQRLWDPELRVPLAVRVPGQPGARIDAPVQSLDLLPALLLHAQGAGPVVLPPREVQKVGGLRKSADFAQWTSEGYQPLPPLAPQGPAVPASARSAEGLRALGYVDPP